MGRAMSTGAEAPFGAHLRAIHDDRGREVAA
jgi:hypothetical protein